MTVNCEITMDDFNIHRTIYWTGVALLILFCAFGKIKAEKSD